MNNPGDGIIGQGTKEHLDRTKKELDSKWAGRWRLTIAAAPLDKAHLGTHQLHLRHK